MARPVRTSINGVRNKLTVKGKDPNFEYRIVNDVDDRISTMTEMGWEMVTDKSVKVGDKRVSTATADGTPIQISVGGGVTGYVMRIKKEWYAEDQAAKAKHVQEIEDSIRTEAAKNGLTGKLDIS